MGQLSRRGIAAIIEDGDHRREKRGQDKDLPLFREMRTREIDNFLLRSNNDDDIDEVSLSRISTSAAQNNEPEKNDSYGWLVTPPSTPLFSSLEDAPPDPGIPGNLLSTNCKAINTSSTTSRRSASPRRPSSPSSSSSNGQQQQRIRGTSPCRPSSPNNSRPATPTRKNPTRPSPSTPTSRPSRPATPTRTPTLTRSLSRTSTPTRRDLTTSLCDSGSNSNPRRNARSSSPSMNRINLVHPAMPGETRPPPNLRTSISDRPTSNPRGASLSPKAANKSKSFQQPEVPDFTNRNKNRSKSVQQPEVPDFTNRNRRPVSPSLSRSSSTSSSRSGSVVSSQSSGMEVNRSYHSSQSSGMDVNRSTMVRKMSPQPRRPSMSLEMTSPKPKGMNSPGSAKKGFDNTTSNSPKQVKAPPINGFRPLMANNHISSFYSRASMSLQPRSMHTTTDSSHNSSSIHESDRDDDVLSKDGLFSDKDMDNSELQLLDLDMNEIEKETSFLESNEVPSAASFLQALELHDAKLAAGYERRVKGGSDTGFVNDIGDETTTQAAENVHESNDTLDQQLIAGTFHASVIPDHHDNVAVTPFKLDDASVLDCQVTGEMPNSCRTATEYQGISDQHDVVPTDEAVVLDCQVTEDGLGGDFRESLVSAEIQESLVAAETQESLVSAEMQDSAAIQKSPVSAEIQESPVFAEIQESLVCAEIRDDEDAAEVPECEEATAAELPEQLPEVPDAQAEDFYPERTEVTNEGHPAGLETGSENENPRKDNEEQRERDTKVTVAGINDNCLQNEGPPWTEITDSNIDRSQEVCGPAHGSLSETPDVNNEGVEPADGVVEEIKSANLESDSTEGLQWTSPARNNYLFSPGDLMPKTNSFKSHGLVGYCLAKNISGGEHFDIQEADVHAYTNFTRVLPSTVHGNDEIAQEKQELEAEDEPETSMMSTEELLETSVETEIPVITLGRETIQEMAATVERDGDVPEKEQEIVAVEEQDEDVPGKEQVGTSQVPVISLGRESIQGNHIDVIDTEEQDEPENVQETHVGVENPEETQYSSTKDGKDLEAIKETTCSFEVQEIDDGSSAYENASWLMNYVLDEAMEIVDRSFDLKEMIIEDGEMPDGLRQLKLTAPPTDNDSLSDLILTPRYSSSLMEVYQFDQELQSKVSEVETIGLGSPKLASVDKDKVQDANESPRDDTSSGTKSSKRLKPASSFSSGTKQYGYPSSVAKKKDYSKGSSSYFSIQMNSSKGGGSISSRPFSTDDSHSSVSFDEDDTKSEESYVDYYIVESKAPQHVRPPKVPIMSKDQECDIPETGCVEPDDSGGYVDYYIDDSASKVYSADREDPPSATCVNTTEAECHEQEQPTDSSYARTMEAECQEQEQPKDTSLESDTSTVRARNNSLSVLKPSPVSPTMKPGSSILPDDDDFDVMVECWKQQEEACMDQVQSQATPPLLRSGNEQELIKESLPTTPASEVVVDIQDLDADVPHSSSRKLLEPSSVRRSLKYMQDDEKVYEFSEQPYIITRAATLQQDLAQQRKNVKKAKCGCSIL